MRSIGKGVLGTLVLSGIGGCSDVTGEMPTAETQLAVNASYVADKDVVIVDQSSLQWGALTVCGAHIAIPRGATQRSCLMHFPVPPMNVTVTNAWLDLRVTDASAGKTNVYWLNKAFDEMIASWTIARLGSANQPIQWQVPGAKGPIDRWQESVGTQQLGNLGDVTFALNSPMGLSMVQTWFDSSASNRGIIFENNSTDKVQFATREDATPEFRPTLHVEYVQN